MAIWITGLSGAGKTTICTALQSALETWLPELVVLDGDVVRAAFGHNLGTRKLTASCKYNACKQWLGFFKRAGLGGYRRRSL